MCCINVITKTTLLKNQFQFVHKYISTTVPVTQLLLYRYNVRVKAAPTWIIQYYNNVVSTSINFIAGEVTRPL